MIKSPYKPLASIIPLLLATGFVLAEDAPLTAVVMLRSDVATEEPHQIDPALLAQLQAKTGYALKWTGNTRTHAQLLQLPAGISAENAKAIASKIETADGVLWAVVQNESKATGFSAVSTASGASISEFVIKLKSSHKSKPKAAEIERLSAAAGARLSLENPVAGGAWVFALERSVSAAEAAEIEKRLEASAEVAYADAVGIAHATAAAAEDWVTPNDKFFPDMWHLLSGEGSEYGSSNTQAAWSLTTGDKNARIPVAVIDTGILFSPTHPDLASHLVYKNDAQTEIVGWDMITNKQWARDGNGRDKNPKDEGTWAKVGYCGGGKPEEAENSSWHGSHVAGTVSAGTNNRIGVSGVNWYAKLIPVRALGPCGGAEYDISDSIWWAAGYPYVPKAKISLEPAKVINMSLGGPSEQCSDLYQSAINFALSQGSVVLVAAGNEKSNSAGVQPANCPGVITVAAVDRYGELAPYSNYGAEVAVAAPGGDTGPAGERPEDGILSTLSTDKKGPTAEGMNYGYMDGTSMATPVVSGIVSLMLTADANGKLTPKKIKEILMNTAKPFPEGSRCTTTLKGLCGAGIVDAYAAVQAVQALQQ
ncbi:MAG: S8 family peptidase [Methylococcus sp.]|nr:S8 family peptidase [Methylococcus sp.]